MSRQESPYTRGYEAGFKAGWNAREERAAAALAEVLLLVKPTDIEAAQARIAKRAQRPAGDPRPDYPGKAAMDAIKEHMISGHTAAFEDCAGLPCCNFGPDICRTAAAYQDWIDRQ